jgi:hypothetical protein
MIRQVIVHLVTATGRALLRLDIGIKRTIDLSSIARFLTLATAGAVLGVAR